MSWVSDGGGLARYLRLAIGADLAKGISLTQAQQQVRLLFGTDEDAGKIRVVAALQGGPFLAKRDKRGNYSLTINAATAEGLFALEFPAFTIERCEALRPNNGQSPHFVFQASKEMLAVEE